MTDAQRAKDWLLYNGFWVTMISRRYWIVLDRKTKDEQIFKTNTEFIAFARSKGWGGEG